MLTFNIKKLKLFENIYGDNLEKDVEIEVSLQLEQEYEEEEEEGENKFFDGL